MANKYVQVELVGGLKDGERISVFRNQLITGESIRLFNVGMDIEGVKRLIVMWYKPSPTNVLEYVHVHTQIDKAWGH